MIFERSYYNPSKVHNFNDIWNSFWCVIVTMTTIGYGDIYPESHIGRLIIITACIWGVFILSLFVVTLNNNMALTKEESNAYEDIVKKEEIQDTLAKDSVLMLQHFFRLKIMKLRGANIRTRFESRMDFVGLMKRFHVKRLRVTSSTASAIDILNKTHQDEEREVTDLFTALLPAGCINMQMIDADRIQNKINLQVLQIHDVSSKLFNLVIASSNGEIATTDPLKIATCQPCKLYCMRSLMKKRKKLEK